MKKLFLYFSAIFILASCQSVPKCGLEKRAAFDIGSGSTKIKAVEVDTCSQQVTRTLFEEQAKVDYRENLEKNPQQEFSAEIESEGLKVLETIKSRAEEQGVQRFSAVATAAFRQAKNGEAVAKRIQKKLAIPLRIISQTEEAQLGFQAVIGKEKVPAAELIVWDIGGGSQQIVGVDEKLGSLVYFGTWASVSFKNTVIEKIQKKDPAQVGSPNPLSKAQALQAQSEAGRRALAEVPPPLLEKIQSSKTLRFFGIGGVLGKSVPRQLPTGTALTQKNIQASLERRAGLTDTQIHDPYAATEITNLALVSGVMKSLGIASYQVTDVALVDGLWFDKNYWP